MLPFQFGLSLGWVDATLGSIMWLYRHMLMWTYPVRSIWTHPIQLSARLCACVQSSVLSIDFSSALA
jgi:hypothetical protein